MCVRSIQYLNYGGQESKNKFAIYDSVTLEQGQVHQTWYKLVNPKQGCNNAKFEKPCLNNVRSFVKSGNKSIISLEYVRK